MKQLPLTIGAHALTALRNFPVFAISVAALRRAARPLLRTARLSQKKPIAETRRFYRYYVSKSLFKISVHQTATVEASAGVAIVALYPRGPLLTSVTRLIDTLVDEGYLVIAVVNKSKQSTKWLKALGEKNITLLSRPNIGRDFGAYKIGYLFAEREGLLANAQHLVFANDSMYYGPRSQPFVTDLLKEEEPWTAMFVNHHFYTHAQSFFIRFSRELFMRKEFHQFWRSYFPSEDREHAILQGEVKLSTELIAAGYAPKSFVTPNRILTHRRFRGFNEHESHMMRQFAWSMGERSILIEDRLVRSLMRRQYLSVNITHAQGTLASRVLGAPLKLDVFASDRAAQEGIHKSLKDLGCPERESKNVLEFMLQVPSRKAGRWAA